MSKSPAQVFGEASRIMNGVLGDDFDSYTGMTKVSEFDSHDG